MALTIPPVDRDYLCHKHPEVVILNVQEPGIISSPIGSRLYGCFKKLTDTKHL